MASAPEWIARLWSLRPFNKTPNTVVIGGEKIEVSPLTLPRTIEIVLLLAPYWPVFDEKIPEIERAIIKGDKDILTSLLVSLREKMQDTPGDMTKMVAILMGVDARWLAMNGTAQEVFKALPTLNKIHNFKKLWQIARQGNLSF